jgi:hypothetical protein
MDKLLAVQAWKTRIEEESKRIKAVKEERNTRIKNKLKAKYEKKLLNAIKNSKFPLRIYRDRYCDNQENAIRELCEIYQLEYKFDYYEDYIIQP